MPQKYCRKLQPPEYGARALQTDRQMTDGRATAHSKREPVNLSSHSLKFRIYVARVRNSVSVGLCVFAVQQLEHSIKVQLRQPGAMV